MTRYFAFALLLLTALHTQAQNLAFTLYLFGDSIGSTKITKKHEAAGDVYVLDTYAKAKILWVTRENHTHYEAVYKDGKLQSSVYYEINNGKKDKWSNIKFDGHQYSADTYMGKKTWAEAPTHGIGTMYCDGYAPNKKRFFNEAQADFNELSFPQANVIEFKSSDGNRNVYHFKNGQIAEVECHTSIATLHIKRTR
ncbi:MAG: hypothetical protein JST83_04935 [Bacteroidetes bacterium]|nr:hypothetical protein [Bacteroidota bacterium]